MGESGCVVAGGFTVVVVIVCGDFTGRGCTTCGGGAAGAAGWLWRSIIMFAFAWRLPFTSLPPLFAPSIAKPFKCVSAAVPDRELLCRIEWYWL